MTETTSMCQGSSRTSNIRELKREKDMKVQCTGDCGYSVWGGGRDFLGEQ